jgi:hypothetical protein
MAQALACCVSVGGGSGGYFDTVHLHIEKGAVDLVDGWGTVGWTSKGWVTVDGSSKASPPGTLIEVPRKH